ncbi:KRAB [Lepeophtheirus salmonis]|uniref:KRAB n=1 Tax=Lepeophtheirus salmonis TaxID=72036 RepID=A0A7R8H4P4_LEPSM|nr:KRAB [Lepeophtheirus salmonis]CAF2862813.1 KRAB [Lepeophtheirus salmonis]
MLLCHNGNHGKDIVTFMDETRRRRMFEDVKIICKDSAVLWAHAAVLGCLSPFLKSLLIVDSPEEDSSKTLVLPDVHSSVMKKDSGGTLQGERDSTEIPKSPAAPASLPFPSFYSIRSNTWGRKKFEQVLQLKKCFSCKRVFGRNLEYELHMTSHRYWQKLKHRFLHKCLSSSTSSKIYNLRNKLIKRSISILLKISQRRQLQLKETSNKESEPSTILFPCPTEPVVEKKKLKLKIKNLNSPKVSEAPDSTWCKICRRFYADVRGLKKHYRRVHSSHLSNTVELRNKSNTKSHIVKRSPLSNRDIDLTCPTCDKVFIAYSIFQRHLKTSHHGNLRNVLQNRPPPPPTPHMNKILQPTIIVRGKETPKYECHLCKQVFLRVKDLAKHRAKMCSAWVN